MNKQILTRLFLGKNWQQKRPLPFLLPRWQIHRGYHLEGIQENTLKALVEAKARGGQMVEFDVRLAQDQTPVVFHDENLKRISGSTKLVQDHLPDELNQLAQIPTLSSVLKSFDVPQFLNIEIKSSQIKDQGTEKQIAQVLKRDGAAKNCLISSFNPFCLMRMSHYLPNTPRALLVSQEDFELNHVFLKEMVFARLGRPHMLNCDEKMLTPEFITGAKKLGVPLAAWTVNDYQRAQELLSLGVVSIISDLAPPAHF